MTIAGLAIAGAAGAVARYGLSILIGRPASASFPWATFFVNVSGSLILGFLVALFDERVAVDTTTRTALTVGFLGAYTTFSTFSLETFRLLQDGAVVMAVAYMFVSAVVSLAAVYLGWSVGKAF